LGKRLTLQRPLGRYLIAWVPQAPRDGETSLTLATKAAPNSATKRLNPTNSRQLHCIAISIARLSMATIAKRFHYPLSRISAGGAPDGDGRSEGSFGGAPHEHGPPASVVTSFGHQDGINGSGLISRRYWRLTVS
jgi:hypothetical protein